MYAFWRMTEELRAIQTMMMYPRSRANCRQWACGRAGDLGREGLTGPHLLGLDDARRVPAIATLTEEALALTRVLGLGREDRELDVVLRHRGGKRSGVEGVEGRGLRRRTCKRPGEAVRVTGTA